MFRPSVTHTNANTQAATKITKQENKHTHTQEQDHELRLSDKTTKQIFNTWRPRRKEIKEMSYGIQSCKTNTGGGTAGGGKQTNERTSSPLLTFSFSGRYYISSSPRNNCRRQVIVSQAGGGSSRWRGSGKCLNCVIVCAKDEVRPRQDATERNGGERDGK